MGIREVCMKARAVPEEHRLESGKYLEYTLPWPILSEIHLLPPPYIFISYIHPKHPPMSEIHLPPHTHVASTSPALALTARTHNCLHRLLTALKIPLGKQLTPMFDIKLIQDNSTVALPDYLVPSIVEHPLKHPLEQSSTQLWQQTGLQTSSNSPTSSANGTPLRGR